MEKEGWIWKGLGSYCALHAPGLRREEAGTRQARAVRKKDFCLAGQESQNRPELSFQSLSFESSLDRSAPADGLLRSLDCQGASARFHNSRPGGLGACLLVLLPVLLAMGGSDPSARIRLLFSHFGFRAQKPKIPGCYRQEERPRVGLGAQPGSLKLPRPQRKSRRSLSSFSFPGCVLLCVGRVPEASQNPITVRRTQRPRLSA